MLKVIALIILISMSYSTSISLSNYDENVWYPMPDGKLYHIDCIHQYDEDFSI